MRYIKTYELFEKKKEKFEPQKVYTPAEIDARWKKKRNAIKNIKENIRKLKLNVDKDLSSTDERTKLTAAIVKIIEMTGERVGNEASKAEGRHGVTNFKKKHISVSGDKITLKYKGKSHVMHDVTFSHGKLATILKELLGRRRQEVFVTEDGFSIRAPQVNSYLGKFNITSKDLRGYKCNKLMTQRLRNQPKTKDEKEIKRIFNDNLKIVAAEIGHTPATLRKHYLLPEIEEKWYKHGSIGRVQKI